MSFDDRQERPFGAALVAAWFVLGAVALAYLLVNLYKAMQILQDPTGDVILWVMIGCGIVLAAGLLVIARGIWRGRPWVRTVACSVLLATAAASIWKGTAIPNIVVAVVNAIAFLYLVMPQRARSM